MISEGRNLEGGTLAVVRKEGEKLVDGWTSKRRERHVLLSSQTATKTTKKKKKKCRLSFFLQYSTTHSLFFTVQYSTTPLVPRVKSVVSLVSLASSLCLVVLSRR